MLLGRQLVERDQLALGDLRQAAVLLVLDIVAAFLVDGNIARLDQDRAGGAEAVARLGRA